MKKVAIQIANPEELALKKQALIDQLMKQSAIQDLLIHQHMDAKLIYQEPFVFQKYLDNQALCVGCSSLKMCRQLKSGYHLKVQVDDYLSLDLVPCAFEMEDKAAHCYTKHIKINHLAQAYEDLSLEKMDVTKDNQAVLFSVSNWLKEPVAKGFYLCGDVGVGKTYLCAVVLNFLAKKGYDVGFVSLATLMQQFKLAIQSKESYNQTLELLMNLDFVVFDDIGSESITPWLRDEILFPILNYRMEHHKWTWFTSNDTMATLYERFRNCGAKDDIKAKRIVERIRVLANETILKGKNRRI